MKTIITSFLLLLCIQNYAQDCEVCKLETKIKDARAAFLEDTVFELSHQLLKINPENFEAHFMLAYYYGLKGRRSENEDYKLAMYDTSRMHAELTFEIDSNNERAHYAMALAMGIVAEIAGPTERIAASKKLKWYCEKSLAFDSTYAKPWYILGRWHNAIANLSWYEVLAADLLFGGAPEGASDEMALHCMKKAVEHEKSFLYYHGLALAYEALDQDDKAIETLKIGLKLPVIEKDALANKKRCEDLLHDLEK